MENKTCIVTGCNGQDSSYLIELLLEKGYSKIVGIYRRTTSPNFQNIKHLLDNPRLVLECGDITDPAFIFSCISKYQPDEFYNLAAMSFVKASFTTPINTFDVDTIGVVNILEAIKQVSPHTKLYQASTSEMFGSSYSMELEYDQYTVVEHFDINKVKPKEIWASCFCGDTIEEKMEILDMNIKSDKKYMDTFCNQPFQNEDTPFAPQSPYAIAKLAAHHMCRLYREAYGLFICSNILFNHESPRRGKEFVTRKITDYIGRLMAHGKKEGFPQLSLGNIYASRDWGFSKDYMEAAWLTLQQEKPDDYVICTGKTHTVEDFLSLAFSHVGLDWKDYVVIDKEYMRPSEVDYLCGDSSRAKEKLGWSPKIGFEELVAEMVDSSIKEHKNG